jgi:uncharacterized membrane protein
MANTLRTLSIGIAAVLPMACTALQPVATTPTPPAAATIQPAELKTFAYNCFRNGYVVADFRHSVKSVWLFLPGTTVELPKADDSSSTGSTALFSNGTIRFQRTANEASLETPDGTDQCIENRARSILEDAKLRGVDYWATGNEPGWILEIDSDEIRFTTAYGTTLHSFPFRGHKVIEGTRKVIYSSENPNHSISVELDGYPCTDSMSGKVYETSANVILDSTLYPGCGRGLH